MKFQHVLRSPSARLATVVSTVAILAVPVAWAQARPLDPPSRPPVTDAQPTPDTTPVVREIRTIVRERDGDRVLPLAVAGLALLIAAGGTGWVAVRLNSLRHPTSGRPAA